MTSQQRKFQTAAKFCNKELRAGNLPTRSDMSKCMREKMGKRAKRKKSRR